MGERRKSRELALEALYLTDISSLSLEISLRGLLATQEVSEKTRTYAKWLSSGTLAHMASLDQKIIKYTKNWELKRMAALDRNILRMGAFELLHEQDTPVSVIIDEAVEIAKIYSTSDSGKFVNGILDKIKLDRPTPEDNGRKIKSPKSR